MFVEGYVCCDYCAGTIREREGDEPEAQESCGC
jgi:hypothetical protein